MKDSLPRMKYSPEALQEGVAGVSFNMAEVRRRSIVAVGSNEFEKAVARVHAAVVKATEVVLPTDGVTITRKIGAAEPVGIAS